MQKPFSQSQINALLEFIYTDDIVGFSDFVATQPTAFNLIAGRFSILSLVYMFDAKKIAAKFNKEFNSVTYPIKIDEPLEAYKKLKQIAGVHLKNYCGDKAVTPSEILALKGETEYLKSNFKNLKPPQSACDNIEKICSRRGQYAKIEFGKIKIQAAKLPTLTKIIFASLASLALIFIAVFGSVLGTSFANNLGLGTANNPFLITNYTQLQMAAASSRHHALANGITLPDDFFIDVFRPRLDGRGHTINSSGHNAPIGVNMGIIDNLTVTITSETQVAANADLGLFVQTNRGRLSNIRFNINADIHIASRYAELIGGAVKTNYGIIYKVQAFGNLSVESGHSDGIFVGGIVGHNSRTGTATHDMQGTIEYSSSDLTITLYAPELGDNHFLRLGGVAGANDGIIRRCQFTGSLTTTHSSGLSDFGSIAGTNYHGTLLNNAAFGQIYANITGNARAFLGGIVGWARFGTIENNFSLAQLQTGYPRFLGGIIGTIYGAVTAGFGGVASWHIMVNSSRNYYVVCENYLPFGTGILYAFFFGNMHETTMVDGDFFNGTDADGVINSSVFWQRRVYE